MPAVTRAADRQFLTAVSRAAELAAEGRAAEGYVLVWQERQQAADRGDEELAVRLDEALEVHCGRYGIHVETGYRHGGQYTLDAADAASQPVMLVMPAEARIEHAARLNRRLVYLEGCAYGQPLSAALALGWCALLPERQETSDPSPEAA